MYGHAITKFSRMGSLPHLFAHGAPLCALRAGEPRYKLVFKIKRQLYQQYRCILSELGSYLFTTLSNKLIIALVGLVAVSTSVVVMPRVAVAAVVVVLSLAASFHFVVAETGVANQCLPVDVLHPNRVTLFSAGVPQV